jgi:hypothetical protein
VRPSIVEYQEMAVRQDTRGVLRIEAAQWVVDEFELIVGPSELPHKLVGPDVDFDDRAKISVRNDQPAVEIEIDGVRMIQIGDEWGCDVIGSGPVLVSGDQRVNYAGRSYSEHLMNSYGVGRTSAHGRAIQRPKAVAEQKVCSAVSSPVEAFQQFVRVSVGAPDRRY